MRLVVNPIVLRLGLTPTLIVRGRRSGHPRATPLGGPFVLDGERYLVSGRGETDWVRNLRAAREGVLRVGRRSERIRATELRGAERDRVVAAYRRAMGRAVDGQFTRLADADDHPVFRLASPSDGHAATEL